MLRPPQGDQKLIRIHFRAGVFERVAGYPNIATTYWPWPSLDELRPHLDIPTVNTGRQYNIPPGPYGCVLDDLEGLHALADERGHIMLTSGIEMPMFVYRGQTQEHLPCVPSLARLTSLEEQLMALCRSLAFHEAIASHPFVLFSEQARLFDAPLCIDRQGLAQHYGLSTDLLDLTSNFDVASFFATCHWNDHNRSYQPVKVAAQPGVLYRLRPALLYGTDDSVDFRYVGWQPLCRPEQQRAGAMRLKKNHDFAQLRGVEKVRFRHSARVSHRIWRSFDGGRALFPNDAAATLAEQAKRLMRFTRSQMDQAWAILGAWHGVGADPEQRERIERSAAIQIVSMPILSWEGLDVMRDADEMSSHLKSVLDKVRYRMAAYG